MVRWIPFLLVLLIPTPARAQGVTFHALAGAMVTTQVADYTSTRAFQRAGGIEANPLMRWVAAKPARMVVVKSATAAGLYWFTRRDFKDGHKVRACATLVAAVVVQGLIDRHNYKLAETLRKR